MACDGGGVAVGRLVLPGRRRDRDPARLLLRRLVDLVVGRERRPARLRQNLRDRRRQRRLAMVDMADRAHVAVRLRPRKLFFRHRSYFSVTRLFFRSEEHTSELQSLMRIPYATFSLKTT